jgi:hypothetical protein
MIPKAIDSITKSDIEALLTSGVPEGRAIDYKLTLPGGGDDDKREFLADVCSFANAAGGDIVFGVAEAAGVPTGLEGVAVADADAEQLRLEEMIRNGIAPRVPGLSIKVVPGFPKGPVIVLRVPRSFASPHMVTFKNLSRFFTRNNAGKYQMDVSELRSAFAISDTVGDRMQRFRTDRLSKLIANETPVRMPRGAKLVLHVLPFSSFEFGSYIDERMQQRIRTGLPPLAAGGWNHRHNLDGFVTFTGSRRTAGESDSYCQLFRTGAVEAVWADLVRERDGQRLIPSVAYERYVLEGLMRYLPVLREFSVPLPLAVVLSMTGVKGAELTADRFSSFNDPTPIDRDVLLLPEVIVEDSNANIPRVMRPVFDAVWNAAGYERSFNYDDAGEWKGR